MLHVGYMFFAFTRMCYCMSVANMATMEVVFFEFVHTAVCMPESLVWSIFTQEAVVTEVKSLAKNSENFLKWPSFKRQILSHGA